MSDVRASDARLDEAAGCHTHDDAVKNGVRTYRCFDSYWMVHHSLYGLFDCWGEEEKRKQRQSSSSSSTSSSWSPRASSKASMTTRALLRRFALSPRDLVPCVHCRSNFAGYVTRPNLRVDDYLERGQLSEHMFCIHNIVNRKAGHPVQAADILRLYRDRHTSQWLLGIHFWIWLRLIAFNYPADIQLDWSNHNTETSLVVSQQYRLGSKEDVELRRRMKTYFVVIDMLKYLLLASSDELCRRWTLQYMLHTPSIWTFGCRTNLLHWVYTMQVACGYYNGSFITYLEQLHPMRSASLSKTTGPNKVSTTITSSTTTMDKPTPFTTANAGSTTRRVTPSKTETCRLKW